MQITYQRLLKKLFFIEALIVEVACKLKVQRPSTGSGL